jgi:hypothetical protein
MFCQQPIMQTNRLPINLLDQLPIYNNNLKNYQNNIVSLVTSW